MPIFLKKWKIAFHREKVFLKKNKEWLDKEFVQSASTDAVRLRKTKSFEECCEKTKRRRINQKLEDTFTDSEIQFVFLGNPQTLDEKNKIDIFKENISSAQQCPELLSSDISVVPFTNDEAVALIIDAKLTKAQYELIRQRCKQKNADILPHYSKVISAKKNCYPASSSIEITESAASINLQDLLDHSVKRLLQVPNIIPQNFADERCTSLVLTSKWGCDGTSGFNEFKQMFSNPDDSDQSLFMLSMVPISLQAFSQIEKSKFIWQNSRSSSTKYCRPIKFQFAKETSEKILLEIEDTKRQINALSPTEVNVNGITYSVQHEMVCTMVDGKVCQVLTATSASSVCTVCGAKPSEMNNLEKVRTKEENVSAFQYELSTLHAWIRFMECMLYIAYRLSVKKWACRTKEEKQLLYENKKRIQKGYRNEMRTKVGLLVDATKQGSGSTNDGNTARRFFRDYEEVSKITGLNKELLRRLYVILQALASGRAIDTLQFAKYASDIASLYVEEYNWFYMPASMHKILIHGASIIDSFLLPIGQLSEEAQESRNKDFKRYRENNTRKSSRIKTIEDLLHCLLISSDPFIASLRKE